MTEPEPKSTSFSRLYKIIESLPEDTEEAINNKRQAHRDLESMLLEQLDALLSVEK